MESILSDTFLPTATQTQGSHATTPTSVQSNPHECARSAANSNSYKTAFANVHHGASMDDAIPKDLFQGTESQVCAQEALQGFNWELQHAAAPQSHHHPQTHQDESSIPDWPLSVEDYTIEDWAPTIVDDKMKQSFGDIPIPNIGVETASYPCYQELVRKFDYELADLATWNLIHHHQINQHHSASSSIPYNVADQNTAQFPKFPLSAEKGKSLYNPTWSKGLVGTSPTLFKESPKSDAQAEMSSREQDVKPSYQVLLTAGEHVYAHPLKRLKISKPEADDTVPITSMGLRTNFNPIAHSNTPTFENNLNQIIRNNPGNSKSRRLTMSRFPFDQESIGGPSSGTGGSFAKSSATLMNSHNRIMLPPNRFQLVDLLKSRDDRLHAQESRNRANYSHQAKIQGEALQILSLNSDLWFEFWKERTGKDFKGFKFPGIKSSSEAAKMTFTVTLCYLDMISAVLKEYFSLNPDGTHQDNGAILLTKAYTMIKSYTAESFSKHRFGGKSSGPIKFIHRFQLVWHWIGTLITSLGNDHLSNIFISQRNGSVHLTLIAAFNHIFCYSIKNLTEKLSRFYPEIGHVDVK
ncbi:hypothetical protein MJO29_010391 [Puccinia striiformis f. sp. tritici]|nr:hypothetical protein MJO29_010391 [Puccinia striiformis f. sp. tritici]